MSALTDTQLQHSAYLSEISNRFEGLNTTPRQLMAEIPTANAEELLALKAKFALSFAQTSFPSFDDMGQLWSGFADATLHRALELAWTDSSKRHKLPDVDIAEAGIFILGLGKLGGQDLNFSSDVDIIAFFDPETFPVPEHMGQSYIASEICKRMTQILQPRNHPEFVWRVDWRLRPESSGTGLAMATEKAETFYFFRSLPWHRLALMKARVVAGDKTAGREFLERLEPYIWRRNLDYTTLEELAALKTRINNEHPGLHFERSAPEPITDTAAGFNLKLGRGGIREIEFIANAQQLIFGGKRPALRTTNTRMALAQLAEVGLLTDEDAKTLREDYSYFRNIENAVQMLENQQTHIVPQDSALDSLRGLLSVPENWNELIHEKRQRVHLAFSHLFSEIETNETSVDTSNLEGANAEISKSWVNGFQDHGLSVSQQSKYKELGQRLTERILEHPSEDQAFVRIDSFLKQIGRSEPYFALLNRHSYLLDRLVTPLLHSPHMSEILRQSPHIIDIFISADDRSLKDQSNFVLTSTDYEHRLEALRRFVNEQLFLAYSKFLRGTYVIQELHAKLTAIAEQTLELSIQIVSDDLGLTDVPITVLGLGKMGTKAMAPQSDLDLIFIFADEFNSELSAKIVNRLRTTLNVKLREGIAYELDMRLRPSGRSGPPAVKLSAFRDHHMKRAHSWEHIALASARIVAGDKALGAKVMTIKNEIFARPRDIEAFKLDAFAMFQRLAAERLQDTPTNIWRSKLRAGGLMTADYILSCLTVVGDTASEELRTTLETWNEIQIWERLLGLTGKPLSDTPALFQDAINIGELETRKLSLETIVNTAREAFFETVQDSELPDPRPIIWKES